jgi:hypothetical protein
VATQKFKNRKACTFYIEPGLESQLDDYAGRNFLSRSKAIERFVAAGLAEDALTEARKLAKANYNGVPGL